MENKISYFKQTLFYLFGWSCYYLFIKYDFNINKIINQIKNKNLILELRTRIVSSTQAIIMASGSILFIFNLINYKWWSFFLPLSAGFGAFDLAMITIHYSKFKKSYWPLFVHHNLLIFAPLYLTPLNSYIIAKLYLFEITVPFIDYSWFLYNSNQNNTNKFKIISKISFFNFLIFRVLNNFLLLLKSFNYSFIGGIITLLFLILNLNWFIKLIKISKII